ncbi:uncharacterized protein V6R79_026105 [Siganus canaliculatus]
MLVQANITRTSLPDADPDPDFPDPDPDADPDFPDPDPDPDPDFPRLVVMGSKHIT